MKLLLLLLSVLLPLAWGEFIIYETFTDVDSAESGCRNRGGHLASIHSADVNTEVANFVSQNGLQGSSYWIGLEGHKGFFDNSVQNYQWTDGTSYDWNNFKTLHPRGTGRMCTLFAGGVWLAKLCDGSVAQSICLV